MVVVAPATVVAAAAAVVVAAFAVVGAAVEALHAPAGTVITSFGWMTWLIPSVHPLAATSASIVMQNFLAIENSESPPATEYCPAAAVVVPGAVLPAVVAAELPAAAVVVAPATVVIAPAAVVLDNVVAGVLGVLDAGLSSEPHAASRPTPITTDTSAMHTRRLPVEVFPFTSFISRR